MILNAVQPLERERERVGGIKSQHIALEAEAGGGRRTSKGM